VHSVRSLLRDASTGFLSTWETPVALRELIGGEALSKGNCNLDKQATESAKVDRSGSLGLHAIVLRLLITQGVFPVRSLIVP
jgi:hypothetical protein